MNLDVAFFKVMKLNKTYQSSDFNHTLYSIFVGVIEAQKLEVCIHKQNCMVDKLSEIQLANMSGDTVSIPIIICGI